MPIAGAPTEISRNEAAVVPVFETSLAPCAYIAIGTIALTIMIRKHFFINIGSGFIIS
jgi:hypothetical protein